MAIACTNDKMFSRLCEVMGKPELAATDRFGLKSKRIECRNEVNGIVADWTNSHGRDEIVAKCAHGGVPCGPICSIADIFEEEQYWARDSIMRVPDPRLGELAVQGVVPKLSATPGQIKHLGVEMGAHNQEIYRQELGLSHEDFERLRAAGVL